MISCNCYLKLKVSLDQGTGFCQLVKISDFVSQEDFDNMNDASRRCWLDLIAKDWAKEVVESHMKVSFEVRKGNMEDQTSFDLMEYRSF